ncbi:hypothetical protein GCM10020331_038650 [Ectobacillus funiculus]
MKKKQIFVQTLEKLQPGQRLLIVFGPEGGLTEDEVQRLCEHTFVSCSLGPRIFTNRNSTALCVVCCFLSF